MNSSDLKVSIAPLPKRDVEYFEEISIPLTITSECSSPLLVESVTLRFQTDSGMSDYFKAYNISKEIAPGNLLAASIVVIPTLEFLTWTNEFQVMVRYKKITNSSLGDECNAKSTGTFVVINPCSIKVGQLFISFKQPEDLRLARLLARVADRAGFTPYLKMDESNPGLDMWSVIEPRILESEAVAFIWTELTEWGDGVEKEIHLAKTNHIQYIPLIKEETSVPSHFKGSAIEYQKFNSEDPLGQFAVAVAGLREIILRKRNS